MSDGFINIGTDQAIIITNDANKGTVSLDGRRTKFRAKAKDQLFTGDAVDQGGKVDHRVQPRGWNGSIECERNSSEFSQTMAAIEKAKYAGGAEQFFTITTYEEDADKSETSIWNYTKCVFHDFDSGEWALSTVKPMFTFEAQEKLFMGVV